MKIKYLHIVNYKAISEIDVDCGRMFNVIIGNNGVGKSTILSAINLLYSWLLARVRSANAKGRPLSVNCIKEGEKYCSLSITVEYLGRDFSWTIYKQMSRFDGADKFKTDLSDLNSLAELMRTRNDEFLSLPLLVSYGVNRNVSAIHSIYSTNRYNLRNRSFVDEGLRADWRSFFGWFVDKENEENRMKVHISPSYKDTQLENVKRVVSEVFKDNFGKMYMHPKKKTLVIEKNGYEINFLDLSDGEKCYLALIMDIARRLESNYSTDEGMVILIDEADLHLHPSWQLSLVENLRSAFPTCQFFLTTHSSLLLSDLKSDENESLWVLKDGRRLTLSGSPYGDDTSYILKRYFALQTVRNPFIQEKIDTISDELSKTDTDIELVAELMKQLDDMDIQYEDNARYKVLLGIKREKNEKDK